MKEENSMNFSKLNKKLLIVVIVLSAIFLFTHFAITALVGTKGDSIDEIRKEKSELRLENEILASEIDSLKTIENNKESLSKLNLKQMPLNFLDEVNVDLALK